MRNSPLVPRVQAAADTLPHIQWLGRRPLPEVYKPFIASNLGAIAQLVEHSQTGLLFKPGDAGVFLILNKLKNLADAIRFLLIFGILYYGFWWAIHNVPALGAFQIWMQPEIWGPKGEATLLKSAIFDIVPAFYESPLDSLLGLGPGHTVKGIGGWMLREYGLILGPIGATSHPATNAIWGAAGAS